MPTENKTRQADIERLYLKYADKIELSDALIDFQDETYALGVDHGKLPADAPCVKLQTDRENRIYVAGPMTGIEDFNFPAFNAVAAKLRAFGYMVENPAEHGVVEGAEWADYMAYDLTRLGLCGVICLLPGWENSEGAKLEVLIGQRLGMTVVNAQNLLMTMEAV